MILRNIYISSTKKKVIIFHVNVNFYQSSSCEINLTIRYNQNIQKWPLKKFNLKK